MRGHIPDIVLGFEFQKDQLKNVGAAGVKFLALPLTWHIAYTTACCYRTSRDVHVEALNFCDITMHGCNQLIN